MAKEYPASKTQLVKAAELGIDTSDRPGYTTLGAALEAAGWSKDGKTQLTESSPLVATDHLESMASRKTDYQLRQERKARGPWWMQPQVNTGDEEDADRANWAAITDTTPSATVPYEPMEG